MIIISKSYYVTLERCKQWWSETPIEIIKKVEKLSGYKLYVAKDWYMIWNLYVRSGVVDVVVVVGI